MPPAVLGPGNPDARTIIAAGRLAHQKGFDILLRAFADLAPRHPGWTLEIYGRGGKREALEALLHQLGLENRARINPPTDRLGERMRDASIYALSSRYEGFPLVLLEAMAAGLAVVAFDCPTGPNEIVTDGRTGLLVPAEDVEAFTSALDRVMTNASLRRRLARAAPGGVAPYRADVIGRRWDELLGRDGREGVAERHAGERAPSLRPERSGS